ncbi:NHL repeat-containing protein [Zavarzinia sp.]|uniref:NHL repeat-containing protein n=1 Tax=Zavarzinia sp. TaxID=2027920 RepID=UPI00356B1B32
MSLTVSLAPDRLRRHDHPAAQPLLALGGAAVILGQQPASDGLAVPIVPGPASLFGPRGACLAGPDGPLVVADTGHHRLMVWRRRPVEDGAPADFQIGQPDFGREGRNAKGPVGPATLNVPTGVAVANGVLAVADAWNHRVLLWHGLPERAGAPADVVLGQADFAGCLANRGADRPGDDTLNWCYGVALDGGRLFVADTGNRRVLVFDRVPERNGQAADLVLGQGDFVTRDENAGRAAGAGGMRWPHAVTRLGEALLVTDAGDNRIMVWRHQPGVHGTPCDFVLGQPDMGGVDHNRAAYFPTADALNMPYGVTLLGDRLVVADTANSRLLGFDAGDLGMGAAACALAGQNGFGDKGDNRWGDAARDSLCWPYNVAACGRTLVVADSGNNRVLLWEAAP